MVGVVHLPADLWTLRTSAPKLDTTVCQLINRLGIQRRPTKRGCRAGRLVRQRYRPDDDINTTETETETDLPFTATPIPVIYPSRRRTSRSAARRRSSSSVNNTSVSRSASSQRLDDVGDNDSQSSSSSASVQHETTASSWCPSSLSPDDQSPHSTQPTDDSASSTTTRATPHHRYCDSQLHAVPSAGRHSTCPTTSRLVLGALNVRSLNNKVDAVRDLFNSRKIDVICLSETWHENSDAVPVRRLRTHGFQVLERARPVSAQAATSSGDFINHGGLAVVARSGLNLSRVSLPYAPTTFECDCVRLSSSGSSCLLLVLYRPGSDHVTSQFFDDLARILEFLASQSSPLVLTGDVNVRLDRPTDPASVRFNDLLESFALTQHVTVSTHRLGGILDVVVTKADDTPSSLQVDDIGLSDHHLITWSVNVRKTTAPNYVTSERRPWKNLDVAQFRSALRSSSLCTDDTTGTDFDVDVKSEQFMLIN